MIFEVLESESYRLKFHTLTSQIIKIPEFNLEPPAELNPRNACYDCGSCIYHGKLLCQKFWIEILELTSIELSRPDSGWDICPCRTFERVTILALPPSSHLSMHLKRHIGVVQNQYRQGILILKIVIRLPLSRMGLSWRAYHGFQAIIIYRV